MSSDQFDTTTTTRRTEHGSVSYEVATCKSCGNDCTVDDSFEFIVGDLDEIKEYSTFSDEIKFHEYEVGHLCEYCASSTESEELAGPFTDVSVGNSRETIFDKLFVLSYIMLGLVLVSILILLVGGLLALLL